MTASGAEQSLQPEHDYSLFNVKHRMILQTESLSEVKCGPFLFFHYGAQLRENIFSYNSNQTTV